MIDPDPCDRCTPIVTRALDAGCGAPASANGIDRTLVIGAFGKRPSFVGPWVALTHEAICGGDLAQRRPIVAADLSGALNTAPHLAVAVHPFHSSRNQSIGSG